MVRSGNPEDVVPQLIQQFGEGEVAAVALQEEVRIFVQGGIRPFNLLSSSCFLLMCVCVHVQPSIFSFCCFAFILVLFFFILNNILIYIYCRGG